jgi:hypothetical protein
LRRGVIFAVALAALPLGACVSEASRDAPAQQVFPTGAATAWVITGHLDESVIDFVGDETVTIKINDQLAAIGGFQSNHGVADARFAGAYRGDKLTIHCTGTSSGKIYVCDIERGAERIARLTFDH